MFLHPDCGTEHYSIYTPNLYTQYVSKVTRKYVNTARYDLKITWHISFLCCALKSQIASQIQRITWLATVTYTILSFTITWTFATFAFVAVAKVIWNTEETKDWNLNRGQNKTETRQIFHLTPHSGKVINNIFTHSHLGLKISPVLFARLWWKLKCECWERVLRA